MDSRWRLENKYSRHYGVPREMALEERLINRHILHCHHSLIRLKVDYAINKQERVAVRHDFEDRVDVENHVLAGR